jgi:hypothetical protein
MSYIHQLIQSRIARLVLIAAGIAMFLSGCESSPSILL